MTAGSCSAETFRSQDAARSTSRRRRLLEYGKGGIHWKTSKSQTVCRHWNRLVSANTGLEEWSQWDSFGAMLTTATSRWCSSFKFTEISRSRETTLKRQTPRNSKHKLHSDSSTPSLHSQLIFTMHSVYPCTPHRESTAEKLQPMTHCTWWQMMYDYSCNLHPNIIKHIPFQCVFEVSFDENSNTLPNGRRSLLRLYWSYSIYTFIFCSSCPPLWCLVYSSFHNATPDLSFLSMCTWRVVPLSCCASLFCHGELDVASQVRFSRFKF